MADPAPAEDPNSFPVLFSDILKWIPRWRDKLVLEVWSVGTFMRLDWSEKHAKEVDAKGRAANEKEWQYTQEERRKVMEMERRDKTHAARSHAALIQEAAEERRQEAEERQKQSLETTIAVMSREAGKIAHEASLFAAHTKDEATAAKFGAKMREKRASSAERLKAEDSKAAQDMAKKKQQELMAAEAKEAWTFQTRLATMQDEKRQQLFDEIAYGAVDEAKQRKENEKDFQARAKAQHKVEAIRQAEAEAARKATLDLLQERWAEQEHAKDDLQRVNHERSTAMRNTAIAKNEFRVSKEAEVAGVQSFLAKREADERATNEAAERGRALAAKSRRETEASAVNEAVRIRTERAEKRGQAQSQRAKAMLKEEAQKQETSSLQHKKTFAQLAEADRKAAEAKRLASERVQAAITKRRNVEMDGSLRRHHMARDEWAEAKSHSPPRSSPQMLTPVQFMPPASESPALSVASPM